MVRAQEIWSAIQALPADDSSWCGEIDGYAVEMWRCSKRASWTTGYTTEARVLTGGVQIMVQTPQPDYPHGATQQIAARLAPGWAEEQLAQRLYTLLDRADATYTLDRARVGVWRTFERLRSVDWFEEEWEAAALASGHAPFVEDMTARDCEFWQDWANSFEKALTIRPI